MLLGELVVGSKFEANTCFACRLVVGWSLEDPLLPHSVTYNTTTSFSAAQFLYTVGRSVLQLIITLANSLGHQPHSLYWSSLTDLTLIQRFRPIPERMSHVQPWKALRPPSKIAVPFLQEGKQFLPVP